MIASERRMRRVTTELMARFSFLVAVMPRARKLRGRSWFLLDRKVGMIRRFDGG